MMFLAAAALALLPALSSGHCIAQRGQLPHFSHHLTIQLTHPSPRQRRRQWPHERHPYRNI
jgi:hypothetical protein